MLIKNSSNSKFDKSVVALGFFDGVHVGHQKLIECATAVGAQKSLSTIVYTFDKHPVEYLNQQTPISYIHTNEQKAEKLNALGADVVIFEKFSDVMNLTPSQFVDEILVSRLNASVVVCGYNFSFGKSASGDVDTLSSCLAQHGIRLFVIPPVCAGDEPISSGRIRKLLSCGMLEEAAILLGENLFLSGRVSEGKHIGKTLGFATANIIPRKTFPVLPRGVYFTKTHVDKKTYLSVTNIGTRPTIRDGQSFIVCESHIIDFHDDIYSKNIKIEFYKKHRDEIEFNSLEELSNKLHDDVRCACEFFKRGESVD